MKQSYQFFIRENNYQRYRKIASFVFFINALIFVFIGLGTKAISGKLILFTTAAILFIYTLYSWSYKRKKEKSYIVIYFLIAAVWVMDTSFWYFSFIFILLLFLQFLMELDFTIVLSENTVSVKRFTRKEYRWPQMKNVILKDGLLTLDFANNKILQVEPDWNASFEAGGIETWETETGYLQREKEFNEFCRQQLKKQT
jgi:hypothetical protein